MATMTDLAPKTGASRFEGLATAANHDRSAGFLQARRHSRKVHTLRRLLPLLTAIIAVAYVGAILKTAGWGTGLRSIALTRLLPTDLTMHNPHYDGYGDDGSYYTFAAATAQPDFAKTSLIKLNEITGHLVDANKTKTELTAKRGVFDTKTNILELFESINVVSQSGLKATLTRATVRAKENLILSDEPVLVEFPAGSIRSDAMKLQQEAHEITFLNSVQANLKPPKNTDAASDASNTSEKVAGTQAAPLFAASDAPITVTSDRLNIKDRDKRAVFSGGVKAAQGTATLTTPELEISYDGGPGTEPGDMAPNNEAAEPAATAPRADATLGAMGAGKVRRIIAKGPVVMTQGTIDRVTSDAADFDALNETAILSGSVVMTSGTDRRATCDRADLDQSKQIAILTGNVVVTQGGNILRGRRLVADRANGSVQLTSPPGVGSGPGRIIAHFVQNAPTGNATKKASKKTDAAGSLTSFQTDPNAPVDIQADELEVQDKTKTAIFRGAVDAVQGNFKLTSGELQVTYSGSAPLADAAAPGSTGGDTGAAQLERIRANRDVVITGADGQKATGDWADMDVKSDIATVGGNVELRQGESVVHGTKLTINMKSGQSTIETAPSNTAAAPAGGGWVTQDTGEGKKVAPANSGRPSAIFFLEQLQDAGETTKKATKNKKQSGTAKTEGQTSSWDVQTAPGDP